MAVLSSESEANHVKATARLDAASLRRAFANYPTGVAVVTAATESGPVAIVINSFISVSLSPPLVAFCAAEESRTWPVIAAVGHCCVNVLADEQEALCSQMARRGTERFAGVTHDPSPGGAPILAGSAAWFDCRVAETHQIGDHELGRT